MMSKWPLALGSLTAAVIGIVVALVVAGVFDSDSGAGPADGEQAKTAALCVDGAEDCEDTVVIPVTDEGEVSDDAGEPAPPPSDDVGGPDEGEALAIEAAFAELEAMGGPPSNEVEVSGVEAVTWSDACLGIQTPGIACAQVITPGYVVYLDAGHGPYTFHTDTNGNAVLAGLPR